MPVYRLPLMLSAARKFSFDNAFLDFSLADHNTRAAAAAAEAQAASRSLCCLGLASISYGSLDSLPL